MNESMTWVPFKTLLFKEIRRFWRVLGQTLLILMVNSSLYLLIFGVSFGDRIQITKDFPYIAFLVPGLVMMGLFNNAFQNAASSIGTLKFHGDLEDFRRVLLTATQITWAMSIGGLCRGLMVAGIVFAVGQAFYWFGQGQLLGLAHPFHLIFFLLIGGTAFSQLGIIVVFWAKNFDQLSAIGGFVLLPLIYLGGVFFTLENLHPFWQTVSMLNPIFYFINGVRYSILGVLDVPWTTAAAFAISTLIGINLFALRIVRTSSYVKW